ncbi:MAG TPA: ORF6N domain-containing protein [Burkholderiales bacterium]
MNNAAQANEPIDHLILQLRGQRVMLDTSLANLYGVPTGSLVQAVKRNAERFPRDFMFQLTEQELTNLKSQIVISSSELRGYWGGRRTLPYAFSEQGVAMLSSVLRSARAIAVNIAIMRAFVRLRQLAAAGSELAKKLDELESRVSGHDRDIANIVRAIRELASPSVGKPKRPIGFISSP